MDRGISGYDTFIFDWDGTLNSMRWLMSLGEVAKQIKYRLVGRPNHYDGLPSAKSASLRRMVFATESAEAIPTVVADALFFLISKPKMHNDALAILKLLKKRGKRVCLFTNGSRWRVIRELKILGIYEYFDFVMSSRDVKVLKPDPRGLISLMAAIKADKRKTVYVGDMVTDIITADLAKIDSCAIADGFDSFAKLRASKPTHIFRSMEDMYKSLTK
ncbi:MAG: HAD family hydrolase [Candidatus Micrarchaeota archaeon]|nr:HAD family hydrolase [Candidatus Micrarchaeota archaeon]